MVIRMYNNTNIFALSKVTGLSICGPLHLIKQKPCQDAIKYVQNDEYIILAVADGHGSEKHSKSDIGAQQAVNVAVDIFSKFVNEELLYKKQCSENLLSILNNYSLLIKTNWTKLVIQDYFNFAEIEVSVDMTINQILELYGTTLLVTIITKDKIICWQLGDGDIVIVNGSNKKAITVFEEDSGVWGTETYSLCSKYYSKHIKIFHKNIDEHYIPVLIFNATDGFKSGRADEIIHTFAINVYKKILESGWEDVIKNLPKYLTDNQHDDDCTLGLININYPEITQNTQNIQKGNFRPDAAIFLFYPSLLIFFKKILDTNKALIDMYMLITYKIICSFFDIKTSDYLFTFEEYSEKRTIDNFNNQTLFFNDPKAIVNEYLTIIFSNNKKKADFFFISECTFESTHGNDYLVIGNDYNNNYFFIPINKVQNYTESDFDQDIFNELIYYNNKSIYLFNNNLKFINAAIKHNIQSIVWKEPDWQHDINLLEYITINDERNLYAIHYLHFKDEKKYNIVVKQNEKTIGMFEFYNIAINCNEKLLIDLIDKIMKNIKKFDNSNIEAKVMLFQNIYNPNILDMNKIRNIPNYLQLINLFSNIINYIYIEQQKNIGDEHFDLYDFVRGGGECQIKERDLVVNFKIDKKNDKLKNFIQTINNKKFEIIKYKLKLELLLDSK